MSENPNKRAGKIYFKVDGAQHDAKGSFSYNLGKDKRSGIAGTDGVHGYKTETQIPYIEGAITDSKALDLEKLVELDGVNVTLELANGKTILLRDAWYAADGKGDSDEGEIEVRFEGLSAEEV